MKEDIIRMARDALVIPFFLKETNDEAMIRLQDFAHLVAAAEREECVRICCEHWLNGGNAMECADAIRAKGQE